MLTGSAMVVGLAACEPPPMQVDATLDPTAATYGRYDTPKFLQLHGTVRCSRRDGDGELPSLVVSAEVDGVALVGLRAIAACPLSWAAWSVPLQISHGIDRIPAGAHDVRVELCTDPAEPVDRDCTAVTRSVRVD